MVTRGEPRTVHHPRAYLGLGFGCGESTGMALGWGLLMSGFAVFGRLSGMSSGVFGIVVTSSPYYALPRMLQS